MNLTCAKCGEPNPRKIGDRPVLQPKKDFKDKEKKERGSFSRRKSALVQIPEKVPSKWTIEQVGVWLKGMGLVQYQEKFKKWRVNGSILINDLNEAHLLKDLEVHTLHYRFLLREIEHLRRLLPLREQNLVHNSNLEPIPEPIEIPLSRIKDEMNLAEKVKRLLFLYPDGLRSDMFEFAWTRHFHASFPKDVEMMMINLLYPYVQVSREGEFFRYTARPPQPKDQIFSKEEFRKSLDEFLYSRPDGVFLYELLNAYEARMETSFPINGLIKIHGKSGFPMLTSILKTYGVFFMNHPKAHDLMIFSKRYWRTTRLKDILLQHPEGLTYQELKPKLKEAKMDAIFGMEGAQEFSLYVTNYLQSHIEVRAEGPGGLFLRFVAKHPEEARDSVRPNSSTLQNRLATLLDENPKGLSLISVVPAYEKVYGRWCTEIALGNLLKECGIQWQPEKFLANCYLIPPDFKKEIQIVDIPSTPFQSALFISGIPKQYHRQQVQEMFDKYGTIHKIFLQWTQQRCALVLYVEDSAGSQVALQFKGGKILKDQTKVDCSEINSLFLCFWIPRGKISMKPLTPHLVRFGSNFSQIEVTADKLENAPSSEGVNGHPEMQYVLVQFSTPEKTREVFSKIQKHQKSLNYYACVTLLNVVPNLRQMATIQRHDQNQSFEDLRSRLSHFGPIVSLTRSQRRESGETVNVHYFFPQSVSNLISSCHGKVDGELSTMEALRVVERERASDAGQIEDFEMLFTRVNGETAARCWRELRFKGLEPRQRTFDILVDRFNEHGHFLATAKDVLNREDLNRLVAACGRSANLAALKKVLELKDRRSLVWTESDWNHLVKLMLSTKAPIEEWQDLLDNAPKETQELWGFPFQQHLVNIVAKNFGATAAENLLTKLFLDEQQYVSLCLDVGQHHFSQGDEENALRLWRQSKSSTEKQLLAIVSRSATKANLPVFDRVIEMIEDKKLTPDAKLGETLIQCLCKHQSMTRLQTVLQLLRKHNISLSPESHALIWHCALKEGLVSLTLAHFDELVSISRATNDHYFKTIELCVRSGSVNETLFLLDQCEAANIQPPLDLSYHLLDSGLQMGNIELVSVAVDLVDTHHVYISPERASNLIPFWAKMGHTDAAFDRFISIASAYPRWRPSKMVFEKLICDLIVQNRMRDATTLINHVNEPESTFQSVVHAAGSNPLDQVALVCDLLEHGVQRWGQLPEIHRKQSELLMRSGTTTPSTRRGEREYFDALADMAFPSPIKKPFGEFRE